MFRNEIIEKLNLEFGVDFFVEVNSTIPQIYRKTFDDVTSKYADGIRENFLPYLRWNSIDQYLYELMENFPKISVTKIMNNANNTAIWVGETKNFILSISAKNGGGKIPKKTLWRRDLGQFDLWESEFEKIEGKVNLTITHGATNSFSNSPDFIDLFIHGTGSFSISEIIRDIEEEKLTPIIKKRVEEFPILKRNTAS